MGRPRPKRGERRIDAAIDHLAELGFPTPRIRKTIQSLLQLYGRDGWVFLEEGSYRVVVDKLLEEEAQEQEAAAGDKVSPKNDMEFSQKNSEVLTKCHTALEAQASLGSSPSLEPVLPLAPAKGTDSDRPPCHGWLSEESETESEPEDDGKTCSGVPAPAEILPSKRKRPSRWDVRPNW